MVRYGRGKERKANDSRTNGTSLALERIDEGLLAYERSAELEPAKANVTENKVWQQVHATIKELPFCR